MTGTSVVTYSVTVVETGFIIVERTVFGRVSKLKSTLLCVTSLKVVVFLHTFGALTTGAAHPQTLTAQHAELAAALTAVPTDLMVVVAGAVVTGML